MKNILFGLVVFLLSVVAEQSFGQDATDLEPRVIIPWECVKVGPAPIGPRLIVEVVSRETVRIPYGGDSLTEVLHFWQQIQKKRSFKCAKTSIKCKKIEDGEEVSIEFVTNALKTATPVFFKNSNELIHPQFKKSLRTNAIVVDYMWPSKKEKADAGQE